MADNPLANVAETFSAPIEGVIVALGQGLSDAQAALDHNSIKTQEAIDADPVLSRHGLQAQWYQFPRVELQLKLALSVVEQTNAPASNITPGASRALAIGQLAAKPLRLIAQPVNAAFQNHFNYNTEASSLITLSIVPVPAPRSADQATLPARMTPDQVREAALKSPAKFVTVVVNGATVQDPKLRFDMNYNSAAGTWYVLQYDPANPGVAAVVAAVDDATGTVRVIGT
jgi:hypothetical protein